MRRRTSKGVLPCYIESEAPTKAEFFCLWVLFVERSHGNCGVVEERKEYKDRVFGVGFRDFGLRKNVKSIRSPTIALFF